MGKVGAGDTLPDVIMADDLVGGALLQVAANPRLAGLFDALLATDEGHEMYLRDADLFGGMDTRGVDGAPTTWGTVCERARERNELALGVMRADGEFRARRRESEYFSFAERSRIVVLAGPVSERTSSSSNGAREGIAGRDGVAGARARGRGSHERAWRGTRPGPAGRRRR